MARNMRSPTKRCIQSSGEIEEANMRSSVGPDRRRWWRSSRSATRRSHLACGRRAAMQLPTLSQRTRSSSTVLATHSIARCQSIFRSWSNASTTPAIRFGPGPAIRSARYVETEQGASRYLPEHLATPDVACPSDTTAAAGTIQGTFGDTEVTFIPAGVEPDLVPDQLTQISQASDGRIVYALSEEQPFQELFVTDQGVAWCTTSRSRRMAYLPRSPIVSTSGVRRSSWLLTSPAPLRVWRRSDARWRFPR